MTHRYDAHQRSSISRIAASSTCNVTNINITAMKKLIFKYLKKMYAFETS